MGSSSSERRFPLLSFTHRHDALHDQLRPHDAHGRDADPGLGGPVGGAEACFEGEKVSTRGGIVLSVVLSPPFYAHENTSAAAAPRKPKKGPTCVRLCVCVCVCVRGGMSDERVCVCGGHVKGRTPLSHCFSASARSPCVRDGSRGTTPDHIPGRPPRPRRQRRPSFRGRGRERGAQRFHFLRVCEGKWRAQVSLHSCKTLSTTAPRPRPAPHTATAVTHTHAPCSLLAAWAAASRPACAGLSVPLPAMLLPSPNLNLLFPLPSTSPPPRPPSRTPPPRTSCAPGPSCPPAACHPSSPTRKAC